MRSSTTSGATRRSVSAWNDNTEARELGAASLKNFFGPDRPYVQGQKDVYARLLEQWGGVPDHLQQNFSRYVASEEDDEEVTDVLDFSGGQAIAHKVWEDLDADTLADRGVVIAGDPDSCIEGLKKHEATGIDQMMIMMQDRDHPSREGDESIELFGKVRHPRVQEVRSGSR